jgi:secretion/DNA translocation related TadE-like protein
MPPTSSERGSATVLGALLVGTLLAVALGVCALGQAVVARHRVQSAADLAALAAAAALPAGAHSACARAEALAASVRTDVRDCAVLGLDVVVTVEMPVRLGRFQITSARAAARAGPPSSISPRR